MQALITQYQKTGSIPVADIIAGGFKIIDFITELLKQSGNSKKHLAELIANQALQFHELEKRVSLLEQFEKKSF